MDPQIEQCDAPGRWRTSPWLGVGLLCWVLLATGCQSLHPFTQRTQERLDSARKWANGGLEALQCGRFEQAKGFFARATAESPNDFRVRANLARTLHQSGETEVAIQHMQQAVEQSQDPRMRVELGQMYLDIRQFSPALRQVQQALNVDQQFAPAWQLQGRIHQARGEFGLALVDLQKAAGLDAELPNVQMDIVSAYRAQQEPRKALVCLEQLLAQHPADSQPEPAVLAKADVLVELDQSQTAIAFLENSLRHQSASPLRLTRLAEIQLQQGQLSQARSTIAQGRLTYPADGRLSQLAGEVKQQMAASPGQFAIR